MKNRLYCMDVMEFLQKIPDASVDLVLTDPPYNIGRDKWDKIDNYLEWCRVWISEAARILTDVGSMYIWHSEFKIMARLVEIAEQEGFLFRQQCIFVKPNFRAMSWKDPKTSTLRNWFNICEYCLYFVRGSDGGLPPTGLEMIHSNPECFQTIKEWYRAELERLGISESEILEKYKQETGKSGAMLRHYFRDSQFEIPTKDVFDRVYFPLGFRWRGYSAASEYEGLRQEYEGLRQEYEEQYRHPHNLDKNHSNVWYSTQRTGSESTGQLHSCEKPVDILERIIRTSTREGQTVLDMFGGSGSTAVAAYNTGRDYIINERDKKTYKKMVARLQENESQLSIFEFLNNDEEGKEEKGRNDVHKKADQGGTRKI